MWRWLTCVWVPRCVIEAHVRHCHGIIAGGVGDAEWARMDVVALGLGLALGAFVSEAVVNQHNPTRPPVPHIDRSWQSPDVSEAGPPRHLVNVRLAPRVLTLVLLRVYTEAMQATCSGGRTVLVRRPAAPQLATRTSSKPSPLDGRSNSPSCLLKTLSSILLPSSARPAFWTRARSKSSKNTALMQAPCFRASIR